MQGAIQKLGVKWLPQRPKGEGKMIQNVLYFLVGMISRNV